MQDLVSLNDPGAYHPAWFLGKEFVEPEEVNFLYSGMLWVGKRISALGKCERAPPKGMLYQARDGVGLAEAKRAVEEPAL